MIVRLQNKDKEKVKPIANEFIPHMSMNDAMQLNFGDKIDHRDQEARFLLATIIEKKGTRLKIHYDDFETGWDTWCDYSTSLHRFAAPRSISRRPAHRFNDLKIGDFICINSAHRHPGWKV